jgi:hypothetical protein
LHVQREYQTLSRAQKRLVAVIWAPPKERRRHLQNLRDPIRALVECGVGEDVEMVVLTGLTDLFGCGVVFQGEIER